MDSKSIEIGQESLNHLNTIRKWSMFMAIMGFIFLGIIMLVGVIAGVFFSAFDSNLNSTVLSDFLVGVFIILVGVVYFSPLLFLFRFSKHTAKAVNTLDKEELYKAIKNLKSYFVFTGILIIIILAVYAVALVMAGTSMAFLNGL